MQVMQVAIGFQLSVAPLRRYAIEPFDTTYGSSKGEIVFYHAFDNIFMVITIKRFINIIIFVVITR